ncbi:TonB-dependent hemoglobin/transferrin/lactoferrin family receptor [Microbaculum marinum]|uniref:TonB-dependent hemoglobin/transferrin/lactoferrin family receptor n=1 Tax=Microbaculum marinum TaxID=1764581 RepID=A0AAW9RQR8_9HYPH
MLRTAMLATTAICAIAPAIGLTGTARAQDAQDQWQAGQLEVDVTNIYLQEITVVPSKTEQEAVDALASVSVVTQSELQILQPTNIQDIFFGMPNVEVGVSQDASHVGGSFNIRGLQDFGRVAVILDGARNNFQRNDHGASSTVWIESEMIEEVTVVRGPVSNLYGSGAIGGVVVFETKSASDFLKPDERMAGQIKGRYETNGDGWTAAATGAARFSDQFDVIGNVVYRTADDYTDGDGNVVPFSSYDVLGGLAKAQYRPTDDQEITLGWIGNRDDWYEAGTVQDVTLQENTFTGKYTYAPIENQWIDFTASGYYVDTDQSQTALVSSTRFNPTTGMPVFVPAGSVREFTLGTGGFDLWNSSTFETGAFQHVMTVGGDWFRDNAETYDPLGGASVYNPSGVRVAYGAYIQDQINYSNWLEIIGALRYDGYSLTGNGVDTSSDRVSPRLSVGVKPFEESFLYGVQFYGSYAEGYRSPSIIETLMTGLHPAGVAFPFLPNPNLVPETAKTWEIGLNFKRDNILSQGDGVRMKAAWFHNDVDDYIGLEYLSPFTPGSGCPFIPLPWSIPICAQYQNIDQVEIQGFEFEAVYDTGWLFAGLQAASIQGQDLSTFPSTPLYTIPPNQVTGRLGFRMLDESLVFGGEVQKVMPYHSLSFTPTAAYIPTIVDGYTLVNLFASWEANENLRFDVRLENLFDVNYGNYLNVAAGSDLFEQGFNAKFAATLRFGLVEEPLVEEQIVVKQ